MSNWLANVKNKITPSDRDSYFVANRKYASIFKNVYPFQFSHYKQFIPKK